MSYLRYTCFAVLLALAGCAGDAGKAPQAAGNPPAARPAAVAANNTKPLAAAATVAAAQPADTTADAPAMSKANPLPAGAKAPGFTYRTADGALHHTDELAGKAYVVYFYPKDMTPGCTTQACGFRDSYAEYEQAGLTVIGVSADSEESHDKFRAKHELPFGLTSDPERKVIEAYGVWGPKLFMGKSFLGINRISFLVGPDGKIAKVYPKVKVADHAAEVLADAKALSAK